MNGSSLASKTCQRLAFDGKQIIQTPVRTAVTSPSANLCLLDPKQYTYVAKLATRLGLTSGLAYELCDAENYFPYVIVDGALLVTTAVVDFFHAPSAASSAMQFASPTQIDTLQTTFKDAIADSSVFSGLLWPLCFGPCAMLVPPKECEAPAMFTSTLPTATSAQKFTTLQANAAFFQTKCPFVARARSEYFWALLAWIFGPLDNMRQLITTGGLDPDVEITNVDFLLQFLPGGTETRPTVQVSARTTALMHIDAAVASGNVSYIDEPTARFCLDNPFEIPLEIDMTGPVVQAILKYSRTYLETVQIMYRYPQLCGKQADPFLNQLGLWSPAATVNNTWTGHVNAKNQLRSACAYLFDNTTGPLTYQTLTLPVQLDKDTMKPVLACLRNYGPNAFSMSALRPVLDWFRTNYSAFIDFIADGPQSVGIVMSMFTQYTRDFALVLCTLCAREAPNNVNGFIAAYYYARNGPTTVELADMFDDPVRLNAAVGTDVANKLLAPSGVTVEVYTAATALEQQTLIDHMTTARDAFLRNLEQLGRASASMFSLEGILLDQLFASDVFRLRAGRRVRNRWITLVYGQSIENFNDYVYSVCSAKGTVPKNLRVLGFKRCVSVQGQFVKSVSSAAVTAALLMAPKGTVVEQQFSIETTAVMTRTGTVTTAASLGKNTPPVVTWTSLQIGKRTMPTYSPPAPLGAPEAILSMSVDGTVIEPLSYEIVELNAGTALVSGGSLSVGFTDCVMRKICEAGLTTALTLIIEKYFSANNVIFQSGPVIFEICPNSVQTLIDMREACLVDGYYAAWAAILDSSRRPATTNELNFIAQNDLVEPIKAYYNMSGAVPAGLAEKALVFGAANLYEFLVPLVSVKNIVTVVPADRQATFAGGTRQLRPVPPKLMDFQQSMSSRDPNGITMAAFKISGATVTPFSPTTQGASDITDFMKCSTGEWKPFVCALKSQYSTFI